jgi:MFS family permease
LQGGFQFLFYLTRAAPPSLIVFYGQGTVISANSTLAAVDHRRSPELSIGEKATVLSGFFMGYSGLQIPAGFWAQRYGGYLVMLVSCLGMSLVLMLAPIVQPFGALPLAGCFCLLGAFQSPLTPTQNVLISRWTPPDDRAEAVSLTMVGRNVGRTLAASASLMIAERLGWQQVFRLYGVLSLLFTGVWRVKGGAGPEDCCDISTDELQLLQKMVPRTSQRTDATRSVIPYHLLGASSAWVIILAHTVNSYGSFIFQSFGNLYAHEVFNLSPFQQGIFLGLPNLAAVICQARYLALGVVALELTNPDASIAVPRRSQKPCKTKKRSQKPCFGFEDSLHVARSWLPALLSFCLGSRKT